MPRKPSIKAGDKFTSSRYGPYYVKEYKDSKNILIYFTNTGYEYYTHSNVIKNDLVKDLYCPVTAGVGYIGDGPYSDKKDRVFYGMWRNMLLRCYDTNISTYKDYGEKGVSVDTVWFNFQNFAKWCDNNYTDGYALDKDIFSKDGKKYSPETCVFIPQHLNNSISYKKLRTDTDGVSVTPKGRFTSSYYNGKRSIFLGTCDKWEDAHERYIEAKKKHLENCAYACVHWGEIDTETFNRVLEIAEEL